MARNYSWIRNPGAAVEGVYETWLPFFGQDYAIRISRALRVIIGGTFVMIVGCVVAFGLAIGVGLAQHSLQSALLAMLCGAAVVVVGFIVMRVGVAQRMSLVNAKADEILRIDPKRTPAEATLLAQRPDLMTKWFIVHPDAFGHGSGSAGLPDSSGS
jgi:hypothetical protein